jgi:hypothetical protein
MMAQQETNQMSSEVPMHKRMAMGEKLDGTSLGSKGEAKTSMPSEKPKKQSGLSALRKK